MDLNTKFIKGEIKFFFYCIWSQISCWEITVITCRLHSDIMVLLKFYISSNKVLEQTWRYFTPMKLWKCSQSLHPLPKVASTPAIEQKQSILDLVIYKHSTHTKLHHPACGWFHEKFSMKKIKSCYSRSILISFSNT